MLVGSYRDEIDSRSSHALNCRVQSTSPKKDNHDFAIEVNVIKITAGPNKPEGKIGSMTTLKHRADLKVSNIYSASSFILEVEIAFMF